MESAQSTFDHEVLSLNASKASVPGASRVESPAAAPNHGQRLAADLEVFESVASELRAKMSVDLDDQSRRKLVVTIATELFGVAPTWVAFYREMMGVKGVIRTLFPDGEALREYENSDEHTQLLDMLTVLRSRDLPENDPSEPQRMITVRIPKSLHDAVCDEANALKVSVNKLCITRMLQLLDDRMIPKSKQKRRGRKPGSPENSKPHKKNETIASVPAVPFANSNGTVSTNEHAVPPSNQNFSNQRYLQ